MRAKTERIDLNQQLGQFLSPAKRRGARISSTKEQGQRLDFSVIFFSDVNQALDHKYQMVFDIAEFVDQENFTAIWIPERHFHPFGGIYPNPSVLASALAVKTRNVRLRSGSVVLPLHHPAEVVESWAVVDHLSGGRVDLGLASGWNANDFVLSPETYKNLKEVWHQRVPILQKLWRGEAVNFPNGKGEPVDIQVYPRPVQKEINIWLTVAKSNDGFEYAGAHGHNILTMLQGVSLNELGKKIQLYRNARKANGFDPETGKITLMTHTLVHQDLKYVETAVREPFFDYIKSALTGHVHLMKEHERPKNDAEMNQMVEYSYERYFKTGALFGSVQDAEQFAELAISVGVNEIACLMDFGVDYSAVMESLPYLNDLKNRVNRRF